MNAKKTILTVSVFIFLLLFQAMPLKAQESLNKIIETIWLKDNLQKENIRIIDTRESIKDYWKSHIPGAVYWNPEAMRFTDKGVPGKMMPPEAIVILLGNSGIKPDTHVVVYSEKSDYRATYFIWILDYLGHKNSSILNGGFEKWNKESLPATQDYPRIAKVKYPLPGKLNSNIRIQLEDMKSSLGKKEVVLLDVRTKALYTGEEGVWKRKGHIKGAINHFWGEDVLSKGVWKNRDELAAAYKEIGATADKTIIVSCGQGQMSSHSYVTLKYILKYPDVKNYDGSFSEWSNIDELPVETGMK